MALPGPPPVVTKISANTVSRKIVSIMITTRDGARQMRQGDVEEVRDRAGAVHARRFLLLLVERLQRGQQDQRSQTAAIARTR